MDQQFSTDVNPVMGIEMSVPAKDWPADQNVIPELHAVLSNWCCHLGKL